MNWIGLLFSRRWWWVTLLVLLGMGVLIRLGFWQLDRLDQRRAANAELRQALAAPPQDLSDGRLSGTPAELQDRQVQASGQYDLSQQLVLKVQNWQGQAGVHLITPLVLADGQTAVLVDRGWIPEAEADAAGRAQYDPASPVTVTGYAARSQTLPGGESVVPDAPQTEWYRVDIEAIAAQMPYRLLPVYVVAAPPPEGNVALPYQEPQQIDLSEGPHLSYAIQWFLFTAILGGGYLIFVRRQAEAGA